MVKSINVRTASTTKAAKMKTCITPGVRSSGSTIRFWPKPKRSSAAMRRPGWSSRCAGLMPKSTAVRP